MDYESSSAMLCSPNKEYSRTRKEEETGEAGARGDEV